MVYVLNFRSKLPNLPIFNVTSRGQWRELSPFYLGPVNLYDNFISLNVENGWQFAKVYHHLDHLDEDNNPNDLYWKWAKNGWRSQWAFRYPAGPSAVPEYSYWAGEKLGYIEARKRIYIPLYCQAILNCPTYKKLEDLYKQHKDIVLLDFDAYDRQQIDWNEVINDPTRKMGHGFVLAMLLEGYLDANQYAIWE